MAFGGKGGECRERKQQSAHIAEKAENIGSATQTKPGTTSGDVRSIAPSQIQLRGETDGTITCGDHRAGGRGGMCVWVHIQEETADAITSVRN